ncbi:MAG: tetratricopeptide repeat protein [Chitinophagaceae bacterium]|nr:tetratricopeptide repeat protein [Chitinophagaceae bacterium]
MKLSFKVSLVYLVFFLISNRVCTQPNTSIDLEKQKPEKYKDKLLNAEKTEDTKIKGVKRFFNNTFTHYNYYFNANVKLNEIIEKAKETFTDDYTQLLPFYNYSLNTTATDKNIDSVIYKCNAGILLHDLRSDWVDDLYMLLGKAYVLRKDFDSAYHVFQYLNYVYAPKDDGYDIPIGSNSSNDEGIFSIATDEKKRPFLQKIIRSPLERNEALLWICRNYLEQNEPGQANALLAILKEDPKFPKRLKTDLYELLSYCYYNQKSYDSSAKYLEKSLGNAKTRAEKARWEFLCGQMYQRSGKFSEAEKWFEKAIKHTSNPMVEVYARLYMLQQFSDTAINHLVNNSNLDQLNKMANKEKFSSYKDIIYYAAGNLSVALNNKELATAYYYKSATTSIDNPTQKNKSFLALADLNYTLKKYKPAYIYYDSIDIKFIDSSALFRVNARKPALRIIAKNIDAIHLQDSLQVLAKLSPKDLNEVLKKIYSKYKKEKGLKDDLNSFDFGNDNVTTSSSIFNSISTNPGEFYFDNAALKSQGIKEFKSRWGNRPNVDNWNRAAAVSGKIESENSVEAKESKSRNASKLNANKADVVDVALDMGDPSNIPDKTNRNISAISENENEPAVEITPEYLYNAIPLTEEKLEASNKIIIDALYENGKTFSDVLDDCETAILTYEDLLNRFPENTHTEKALFNLAYCYKNTNRIFKSNVIIEALNLDYGDGTLNKIIKEKTADPEKTNATKTYSDIYKLFLQENYQQAVINKKHADSLYKGKYWNPQLSLIESIYYIKQHADSTAIDILNTIIKSNADKALKEKAATMIDVLNRKQQIITHLNTLDTLGKFDSSAIYRRRFIQDSIAQAAKDAYTIDSSLIGKPFSKDLNAPHYAVLLLTDVENAFINETKKSLDSFNVGHPTTKDILIQSLKLNRQYTLMLIGPLSNATMSMYYIEYVQPKMNTILPWMPLSKYSFSLISLNNLEILKANNNMEKYKVFLKSIFPDKF